MYVPNSVQGSYIDKVVEYKSIKDIEQNQADNFYPTVIDKELIPVLAQDGLIKLFSSSEFTIKQAYLSTHSYLDKWNEKDTSEGHLRYFLQNVALYRYKEALKVAKIISGYYVFNSLSKLALSIGELEVAEKTSIFSKNVGMV